jgi:hypothetical protein
MTKKIYYYLERKVSVFVYLTNKFAVTGANKFAIHLTKLTESKKEDPSV